MGFVASSGTTAMSGDDGYETLIRSLFVYEYRDAQGSWFVVNPLLAAAKELETYP